MCINDYINMFEKALVLLKENKIKAAKDSIIENRRQLEIVIPY